VSEAESTSPHPAEERDRSLRGRALVLLGLASIAVTQPLLDLFGRNPEFFVVGRYSRWQILVFALGVALVPALLATGLVALAGRVSRRVRGGINLSPSRWGA